MDKVKITLYEISGYLLPGLIGLLPFLVIFNIIKPQDTYIIDTNTVLFVLIAICSYFNGHFLQGISNLVSDIFVIKEIENNSNFANIQREYSNNDKKQTFYIHKSRVKDKLSEETYNTFTEREGFYRACTVAFSLLSITLVIFLFFANTKYIYKDYYFILDIKMKIYMLFLSIASTIIYFQRYKRFIRYRVNLVLNLQS